MERESTQGYKNRSKIGWSFVKTNNFDNFPEGIEARNEAEFFGKFVLFGYRRYKMVLYYFVNEKKVKKL